MSADAIFGLRMGAPCAFDRIACCKAAKAHKKLRNLPFDGSGDLCLVTFDGVAAGPEPQAASRAMLDGGPPGDDR